ICIVLFSSRRRHTSFSRDWSSDVCSSDLFDRRRVIRACLTGNETFGGFERHHLLDGVELKLLQLRLTLGLEVQLAGNGALDQVRSEERRVGKGCSNRGVTEC